MEKTTNYKLYKPSYDDDVDIQILNNNMDILDDNLKRNNDKFKQYLPLSGGTMQGDIKLPYNSWQGLRSTRTASEDKLNDVVCFVNTSLGGTQAPSLFLRSDRLVYYTPNDVPFWVDNTGVWFDNDKVITDSHTDIGWHAGYVKLSTGLCIQWGYVNPQGSTYNVQHATFQTPMLNPQYAVVTSRSFGVDNKPTSVEMRWGSATFNLTTTGFDIVCAEPSAYGHTEFWIAIGRHK